MFGALRRCPINLARTLPSVASTSRALRSASYQSSTALRIRAPRFNHVRVAAFHQSRQWQDVAAAEAQSPQTSTIDEPVVDFQDLASRGLVHPNVINTITKRMKLETMTEVQVRTINEALSGTDVVAQAKTGTGKTLGFLIPVVQRIIEQDPKLSERSRGFKARAKPNDIRAIIISPTRELAEQIAVEAKKVTEGTSIIVQAAVGGTQKRAMLQKTQREGCHLLIGTPGRLLDILSDQYSGVRAPNLDAMVLDEADRLLDDGFQKEIEEIRNYLPKPEEHDRQTMMFSATIPRDVVDLVRRTLKPGFHFAQCVNEDEAPTHEKVPQKFVQLAGFENIMPSLYELVVREVEKGKAGEARPFKAIIYFNSTAEVTVAASVFYKLGGGFKRDKPLFGVTATEIHSRLTQMQRSKASDKFRSARSGLLFSSDVTARGMDFPDVTHVIQVGLPRDRESYIHRLGRTGRAGKEGEGWLFINPLETAEKRKRLPKLPIDEDTSLETAAIDMAAESEMPENIAKVLQEVTGAHQQVYPDQLEAAFRGLFGAYQWCPDREGLLDAANRLAEFGWGMPEPPAPPSSFYASRGRRPGGARGGGFGRSGGFGGGHGGSRPGSFGDRDQRGPRSFNDRPRSGGFGGDRRGGRDDFQDRRPRDGFQRREPREGGFQKRAPREGEFQKRAPREGEFQRRAPREGEFQRRAPRDDFGGRGGSRDRVSEFN